MDLERGPPRLGPEVLYSENVKVSVFLPKSTNVFVLFSFVSYCFETPIDEGKLNVGLSIVFVTELNDSKYVDLGTLDEE